MGSAIGLQVPQILGQGANTSINEDLQEQVKALQRDSAAR